MQQQTSLQVRRVQDALHDGVLLLAEAAMHERGVQLAWQRGDPSDDRDHGVGEKKRHLSPALFNEFLCALPQRLSIDVPTHDAFLGHIARDLSNALVERYPYSSQDLTPSMVGSMAEYVHQWVSSARGSNSLATRIDKVPFAYPQISPIWLLQAAHALLRSKQAPARRDEDRGEAAVEEAVIALACIDVANQALNKMRRCRLCFRWAVPGLRYCGAHSLADLDGTGKSGANERQRRHQEAGRVARYGAWSLPGLPRDYAQLPTNGRPLLIARILWETAPPAEIRTVQELAQRIKQHPDADIAGLAEFTQLKPKPKSERRRKDKPEWVLHRERTRQLFAELRARVDPFEYRTPMWTYKVQAMEAWDRLALVRAPGHRGPSHSKVQQQIRNAERLASDGYSKVDIAAQLQVAPSSVSRWLTLSEGQNLAAMLDDARSPELAQHRYERRRRIRNGLAKKALRMEKSDLAPTHQEPADEPPRLYSYVLRPIRPIDEVALRVAPQNPAGRRQIQYAGPASSKKRAEPAPSKKWAESDRLLADLDAYLIDLDGSIRKRRLKHYVAYRHATGGNFATLVGRQKHVLLYLHLDPAHVPIPERIGRDMRERSHAGTGDIELTLKTAADLEIAKSYLKKAYRAGRP